MGFLKRLSVSEPFAPSSCGFTSLNTRLFKKKDFSVAFVLLQIKLSIFRIKYSIMDFPVEPLLNPAH